MKTAGSCSLCDRECFDILERYPQEHPLAGVVRRLGAAQPHARRAEYVLVSGSRTSLTLCDQCDPYDVATLWHRAMEASYWNASDEQRQMRNPEIEARSPEAKKQDDKILHAMSLDVPLGLLWIRPWADVLAGEEFYGHVA